MSKRCGSVLWSVNYPSRLRARITGRITINTSIALAITGLGIGWLLGHEGPWWRIAIVVGSACGVGGAFAFRQFKVRREDELLEAERARVVAGATFGSGGMRALLARDEAFRRYQYASLHLEQGDALQHAHRRSWRGRPGRARTPAGAKSVHVQHDHGLRRHLDGHRRACATRSCRAR